MLGRAGLRQRGRALSEEEAVIVASSENRSGWIRIEVTASGTPPASVTSIWGFVVSQSGVCIPGAMLTVVSGQGAGRIVTQTTPCDGWGYGNGFILTDLTPDVEMTVRAPALDCVSSEMTIVPQAGGPGRAIICDLIPIKALDDLMPSWVRRRQLRLPNA